MDFPVSFHSAKYSLFQSIIRHIETKDSGKTGLVPASSLMDHAVALIHAHNQNTVAGLASTPAATCIKLLWDYFLAWIERDKEKQQEIESEYKDSPCDPGWLTAVADYVEYYILEGDQPEYVTYTDINQYVYPMPDKDLTVGILGDWGTGESVAQVVLDETMKQSPDLIIHVGDVYYAGTPDECAENFLNLVNNARKDKPIPVYTMPGNHDMYSGGKGFYGLIGEVNKPPYAPDGTLQQASYFCLRNQNWQLQAMDTGYHDHDLFKVQQDYTWLQDTEVAWHQDKLNTAGDRKVILFSHHQLFSAFLEINSTYYNDKLYAVFKDAFDRKQVPAWFWGHEHVLEIYGPFMGLPAGRCVGHSAFPVLADTNPYNVTPVGKDVPLVPDPKNPGDFIKLGTTDKVFNHGYTILKLTNTAAEAEYYEVSGTGVPATSTLRFSETIWSAGAV